MRAHVIELFAGIGTVARAFEGTGSYRCAVATDGDPAARDNFCCNDKSSLNRYILRDARRLCAEELLERLSGRQLAGVLGCPPCQGLSDAGYRRSNDKRNSLLLDYFRLVDELQPKFFLMENVPGLLIFPKYQTQITSVRRRYRIVGKVLNSALYGTPQTRQRAIIIGYHRDLDVTPTLPHPTHLGRRRVFDYTTRDYVSPMRPSGATVFSTYARLGRAKEFWDDAIRPLLEAGKAATLHPLNRVGDAIADLPPASDSDGPLPYTRKPSPYARQLTADAVHNHKRWRHRHDLIQRLVSVPEGHGLLDADGRSNTRRYFSQAYSRLHRHGLARTITTNFHNPGSGRFTHYKYPRALTVREAARLQGISDDFVFLGDQSVQERLVGNAFPVPLAEALARHIAAELRLSSNVA